MTKPSETAVLTELRSTTLAYLSDADFKEVEKAVERDGILSLKGSVATVVKDAVLKHGTHNQSSHGKGGKGGRGGGGGGGTNPGAGSRLRGLMDRARQQGAPSPARVKEARTALEAKAREAGKSDTQMSQGMKAGFLSAAKTADDKEGFERLLESAKTAFEKPQPTDFIMGIYAGISNAKSLYPDVFGGD